MKLKHFIVAGTLSIGALLAGIAVAQTPTIPYPGQMGPTDRIQIIPNGQPSAQSVYAGLGFLRAWVLGGASGHSGTPALTSCGGGTPTITGTDNAFTVTQGTSATGCVATFAKAFTAAPTCVAVNQTAPGTSTPAYTVSVTAVTLVTASTSGEIWQVMCTGT